MASGPSKITVERNQRILMELVLVPGNDVCADCRSRNPRWASHNLGIFLCVSCASIHRKMGTHITKVKSITLDSWTKEQVEVMKQNGNVKSNAHYNPNEARHPPPTNMIDTERDSELEKYIRNKYEFKRFIDRSALASSRLDPSRSVSGNLSSRPKSTPVPDPAITHRNISSAPALPAKPVEAKNVAYGSLTSASNIQAKPFQANTMQPTRSISQPLPSQANALSSQVPPPPSSQSQVWNDLISLQTPAQTSSLPLQYQAPSVSHISIPIPSQQPSYSLGATSSLNPYSNISIVPGTSITQMPHMSSPIALSPSNVGPGIGFQSGLSTGSVVPVHVPGANNPFQQQPPGFSHMSAHSNLTNPFNSYLPSSGGPVIGGTGAVNPSLAVQPPSLQPFHQGTQSQLQVHSHSHVPVSVQPQIPGSQFFQPQQQLQQAQYSAQQPFSGSPSPYPAQPDMQQQQQYSQGNPYALWHQGQQQGGQPWGNF
ncbi:hypothetical protein SERLA73DRAFT_179008 [Serpula lacrymans var. lacrymans S7.3]|uniref:Arf-GAP domain-containing protein n=2 Tax=Serpula lacrymans var. lacrymans TaxID=341189 RepID=F8PTG3_SERL3|nr:uncharacterized protein SERLADRAFT_463857 [Serpula lacrymans var. lacrymans S7.9]EGO00991.1 hypothetical protein SERLA73DRAFT_179008 [Serpula lacrymans var. lacrymans S7.3]EGO26625.1 hypothetical protein SERLADRAFT_463857 [Serpula lacrymans var. lacrymans S7.9]